MTALERKWAKNRWRDSSWSRPFRGFSGWHERSIVVGARPVYLYVDETERGFQSCIWGLTESRIDGPLATSLAKAKSDAEAMYRQWVYDEYGVVLA